MSDKLKASLTNSYLMFIFDFADPSTVDKDEVLKCIECPVIDIFKSQKQADKAKKMLGKQGFGKALVLYFGQFQSHDGVDFKRLESELSTNRKVFQRHLGKDKVNYLGLMISVSNAVEPKKRGLLSA